MGTKILEQSSIIYAAIIGGTREMPTLPGVTCAQARTMQLLHDQVLETHGKAAAMQVLDAGLETCRLINVGMDALDALNSVITRLRY